jgi:Zn-dependent M16 (insulinase) family peptidase
MIMLVRRSKTEANLSAYVAVRTRAEDDTGVPHVLEHMCFSGSRRYSGAAIRDNNARFLASRNAVAPEVFPPDP